MDNTRQLIDYAAADDAVNFRSSLYAAIHDKVTAHIENKKQEIASSLVTSEEVKSLSKKDEKFHMKQEEDETNTSTGEKKESLWPGSDEYKKRFPREHESKTFDKKKTKTGTEYHRKANEDVSLTETTHQYKVQSFRKSDGSDVASSTYASHIPPEHIDKLAKHIQTSKSSHSGKDNHIKITHQESGKVYDSRKANEDVSLTESYDNMSHEAKELVLHADSDERLHHSSHTPIMSNLRKKMKAGKYDSNKAKDLWKYHADRAAISYHKEHGGHNDKWHEMFSPTARKQAAAHWEQHHRDELKD